MTEIRVAGKTYTIKFSYRAARYKNCADTVMSLLVRVGEAEEKEDLQALVGEVTDIPLKATELFYAGLLQMHGNHPKGDGSVPDIETAEELLDEYLEENRDQKLSYSTVLTSLIECMGNDGFFDLIGLNEMLEEATKSTAPTRRRRRKATQTQ